MGREVLMNASLQTRAATGCWASALLIGVVATGCGSAGHATVTERAQTTTTAATTEKQPAPVPSAELSVSEPSDSSIVRGSRVRVRGTATPGARVTVANVDRGSHQLVATARGSGHWAVTATLEMGDNDLHVRASKHGYDAAETDVTPVRKLTVAQERARRAAARARKLAQQQAARQTFINAAGSIPYKQLIKDPDSFRGKHVTFRGQILQIQQSGGFGGIMLLSVTDHGYDIWDDNVWIDYDHAIKSAEGDIITVYGTMTGSKSYDTQAGGSTFVPRMHARYVVEG
jgi:hypothetical protein